MQVIHGREVPDGPIEAAKEFISLAVSGLATARNDAQKEEDKLGIYTKRDMIQDCIDELSTVQWHVLALQNHILALENLTHKEVTSG